jgi:hypothetical protein
MYLDAYGEPLADEKVTAHWKNDAVDGSSALLEALFRASGEAVPPAVKVVTISSPGMPDRKVTTCKHCGSPIGNNRMLVATIQATVAAYYRIDARKMTSAQRSREFAHPRQIAMFLAGEMTNKSLPEIGRRFGGRDHTTVIHAIKAVKHRIETDPEIAADVELLRAELCPETLREAAE